jgi:serine/threonine protein kinase
MDRHPGIPAAAHSVGSVVDGRYEIVGFLGAGGMSAVYKARDLQIDRPVVLKFIRRELLNNPRSVDRFIREANLCSRLRHPGIVQVFSCGVVDGNPYLAMEYIEGASLDKVLAAKADGHFSQEEALPIFEQLCDALDYAHRVDVLHRDLKPHNVMVSESGAVKLVDFGIATLASGSGEIQKLTQTGELIGSVAYMSPEQCRGEKLDARSDIYSLGCLMYELLVGTPPFRGETPYAVLMKHLQEQPKTVPQLDGALGNALLLMLEKDPGDRPQSAGAAKELINNPSIRSFKKRLPLPFSKITVALVSILLLVCVWTAILEASPDTVADEPSLCSFSDLMMDGQKASISYAYSRDQKVGKHALYCLTEACGRARDRDQFRRASAYRSQILYELGRLDEAVKAACVVTDSPAAKGKNEDAYRIALYSLQCVADRRNDGDASVEICKRRIAYEQGLEPTAASIGALYHELGGYFVRLHKSTEAIKCYESALQHHRENLPKFLTLREMASVHLSSIPTLNSASARLREYEAAKKEFEVAVALTVPPDQHQAQEGLREQLNDCNRKIEIERARI